MVTKKSNSGKKKKIPNQNQAKKQPKITEEEKARKKRMDRFSFLWMTMAIMYFGLMVLSWQLSPETMAWQVANLLSYASLMVWGILLIFAAKYNENNKSGKGYRIVGIVLVVMSLVQIIPAITQMI